MKIRLLFYLAASLIIFNSCTLTKRVHSRGYHVEWNKRNSSSEQVVQHKTKQNAIIEDSIISEVSNNELSKDITSSIDVPNITADHSNELVLSNTKSKYQSDLCDEITLKNGEEIKVKVVEIDNSIIKYKKCDNVDGPLYSIEKSKVLIVRYANGTKDVFADKEIEATESKTTSQKRKVEPASVLSWIFSIAGILIGLFLSMLVGLILSGLAFILGIIGIIITSVKSEKYKGKAFAIIGMIFGLLGLVFFLLLVMAILFI